MNILYVVLFNAFLSISSLSSLCQTVLFVTVATLISKTFHLFLTVPLIIPQRVGSFSLLFFTKHIIFSIQSCTGTFFSSPTFVSSFSSNANILDLNYVSPCVHVFTSFHFFLYSQRILKFFYNHSFYHYGFVYKSAKHSKKHLLYRALIDLLLNIT